MKSSAVSPLDALRDALGHVIAGQRREWRRERELMAAQSRAAIAELRAENVALVARMEEMVRERLAGLRDGRDGVDGAAGRDGRDGTDGRDAEAVSDAQLDEAVARYLSVHPPAPGRDGAPGEPGPRGEQGEPGRDGQDAPVITEDQVAAAAARWLEANPPAPGRDGRDGQDGIDGRDGIDGVPGRDGVDGQDGAPGREGERGPEGPAGKLPLVRAWSDRIHYEGAVVAHDGGTWQAQRDTARAPPHEDWICIAAPGANGQDGGSFSVRGTWGEAESYERLDVVALNGAAFVARRDNPGPCPGDGWQMIAAQGKRGQPGERGLPGQRGEPGPSVIALDIDREGLMTLSHADGSTVTADLYPLLSKLG